MHFKGLLFMLNFDTCINVYLYIFVHETYYVLLFVYFVHTCFEEAQMSNCKSVFSVCVFFFVCVSVCVCLEYLHTVVIYLQVDKYCCLYLLKGVFIPVKRGDQLVSNVNACINVSKKIIMKLMLVLFLK